MTTTSDLIDRQEKALPIGIGTKPIYAERAANAEIWDVEGKRYIDFAAGIAVNNTGHRHPRVMAAVAHQAEHFTHTCFHVAPYEGYIALAERLNELAPVAKPAKTMMVTTGAEAVENAIKIARIATGRSAIISFSGGFHGRTLMALGLTGKVTPYKKGFGPFPLDIYHAPFPYEYLGLSSETALSGVKQILSTSVDPDRVAAFIIEPIQGEGGFIPAPREFLEALRQLADEHGILLIADEVQAGMGRTGKMFSLDHSDVKADLITIAKGVAGGFPLSAVVGRADIMDVPHVGGLGGTYAGNPISVAAANAVLDVIVEEDLCERAQKIGEMIFDKLNELASRQGMEAIGDVRGKGAMIAFELVKDRTSKEPDPELAKKIVQEAQERGLILLVCGTRFNVVRILPPLTTTNEIVVEAVQILEASIDAAIL
ncbi:MAG: 4-aminobutyrate--2-oxoglutarate transaminase [Pseudomonadota bacterium]